MSYPSLSVQALCSVLLIAACDSAVSDQKAAAVAQTEANTIVINAKNEASEKVATAQAEAKDKVIAANLEADQKAKDAQLEADKKVAAANDSVMKLREDFRHAMETNLIELDHNVADLEARAKRATGRVRADLHAQLKQIHARRDALAGSCKALEAESAATWDETKARLEKEWTDLKTLVDSR